MEEKIKETLEKVRPFLQRDGGDVEFVAFVEGTVQVKLQGACAGCAGAQMTIKNLIERVLKEKFPEDVKEVVGV